MHERSHIRCDDTTEGAAVGLLALMTGISEEFWCAGWMSNLEYDLWEVPPGKQYGQGEITERQSSLLRLLSEECGGWWCWIGNEVKFVSLSEWAHILSGYTV